MRTDVNGSGSISDERDLEQVDASDTPVVEEGLETKDESGGADESAGEVAMEVVEPDPVDPQPDPEPVEPDPEPVEPDPEPVEPDPEPLRVAAQRARISTACSPMPPVKTSASRPPSAPASEPSSRLMR